MSGLSHKLSIKPGKYVYNSFKLLDLPSSPNNSYFSELLFNLSFLILTASSFVTYTSLHFCSIWFIVLFFVLITIKNVLFICDSYIILLKMIVF